MILLSILLMSYTTFHSPISPCGPLEQSPTGDSLRHGSTAPLRSPFDFGENVVPAKDVVRCAGALMSRCREFMIECVRAPALVGGEMNGERLKECMRVHEG